MAESVSGISLICGIGLEAVCFGFHQSERYWTLIGQDDAWLMADLET